MYLHLPTIEFSARSSGGHVMFESWIPNFSNSSGDKTKTCASPFLVGELTESLCLFMVTSLTIIYFFKVINYMETFACKKLKIRMVLHLGDIPT